MSRATLKVIQAAAGNAGEAVYVDDVFSTYLYTGTNATQAITNGLDLAGEGGLVWTKARTSNPNEIDHQLMDSEQGAFRYILESNTINARWDYGASILTPNSDGFTLSSASRVNQNGDTYVSWSFRKQPGFFDVVTYTGTGSPQTISHNLGSVPGAIITKRLDSTSDWAVYHRSYGSGGPAGILNGTDAAFSLSTYWNNTDPTSTEFTLGSFANVNTSGGTYVAYLFAHDEQDFGTDSDESIIKCGSYTGNGSTTSNDIDIGFEPQWILIKNTTSGNQWYIFDVMRGIVSEPGGDAYLLANTSGAEVSSENYIDILPNGFSLRDDNAAVNASSSTYIYVAIRRPHKPAEEFAATALFDVDGYTGAAGTLDPAIEFPFDTDMFMLKRRNATGDMNVFSRLTEYPTTGGNVALSALVTSSRAAEADTYTFRSSDAKDIAIAQDGADNLNVSGGTYIYYGFRRAPWFFDVVTYTGTGGAVWHNHNLGVVPEMIICKGRNIGEYWNVFTTAGGTSSRLHLDEASEYITTNASQYFPSLPTATQFRIGQNNEIGGSGYNYIAYLFASVDGISKLGTYTGTGSAQDIDCGFSAGARFVLIKRVDVAGYWIVWDSERGIVAGNDPYLFLNTTAAEVTSTDYIDPLSSGFTITSSAPTDNSDTSMNKSGGTYFFYAIA